MGIAEAVSKRASCPRASVGAVLVSPDHRILATGYNGAPKGNRECLTYGCTVVDDHRQTAVHAEVNAVGYAARFGVPIEGARLYMFDTGNRPEPCRECRKVLLAAGVRW